MTLTGTTTPEVHSYSTADRQIDPEQLYFDLAQFDQSLTAEQQAIFDRAGKELETTHTSELRSGKRRRTLEYHVVNDTSETESDLLVMTGWGQTVSDLVTAHIVQILAAKYPNKRIVIPTTPGLDGTDRLPDEILRSLKEGSFEQAGGYILEAMRPALQDDKPLDVLAYSQGASFAAGVGAGAHEGEIRDMRVIDPAALEKRNLVDMYFASRENNAHAGEAWQSAEESVRALHDASATQETPKKGYRALLKEVGRSLDMYIRLPRAMGKAALLSDVARALEKMTGSMTVVIGEKSEYNKVRRVQAALATTAFMGIVQLGVFSGNHSSLIVQPHVLAALA